MSSQNPVFIPGPTNIPERLRHACNVPTIDHRSSSFGTMFKPLFAGVKEVLKTRVGRGHHVPGQRHRRLGGGDLQHAVAGRQGPRLPPRHVLAPLDRHVQAARARRRPAQRPVGRRRPGGRLPGRARGGQGPRDQGRPRHPQRDRHRRPLRRRRHSPRDGRGEAPGAAARRHPATAPATTGRATIAWGTLTRSSPTRVPQITSRSALGRREIGHPRAFNVTGGVVGRSCAVTAAPRGLERREPCHLFVGEVQIRQPLPASRAVMDAAQVDPVHGHRDRRHGGRPWSRGRR